MTAAIVDTGPLVALFDRAERHDGWVAERFKELDASRSSWETNGVIPAVMSTGRTPKRVIAQTKNIYCSSMKLEVKSGVQK